MLSYLTGAFEIGTVDTNSGAHSTLYTVAEGASEVATALTIIPEPATAGLLMIGGFALMRRRG